MIKQHVTDLIDIELKTAYTPVLKARVQASMEQFTRDEFFKRSVDAGLA